MLWPFLPQLRDKKFCFRFISLWTYWSLCMSYRPRVENFCSKRFQNLAMVGPWSRNGARVTWRSLFAFAGFILEMTLRYSLPCKKGKARRSVHELISPKKDSWEHKPWGAHELRKLCKPAGAILTRARLYHNRIWRVALTCILLYSVTLLPQIDRKPHNIKIRLPHRQLLKFYFSMTRTRWVWAVPPFLSNVPS